MDLFRRIVKYTFFATVIFCVGSFLMMPHKDWLEFISNLLLNLVAECLGIAISLLFTLWLAKNIAGEKIKEFAPHLVRLIRQLREEDKISGRVAQECVNCAVRLLSESSFPREITSVDFNDDTNKCGICKLQFKSDPDLRFGIRCVRCGLPQKIWSDKVLNDN